MICQGVFDINFKNYSHTEVILYYHRHRFNGAIHQTIGGILADTSLNPFVRRYPSIYHLATAFVNAHLVNIIHKGDLVEFHHSCLPLFLTY